MARCHGLQQVKWGLFSLKAPKNRHLMLNSSSQSSGLKLCKGPYQQSTAPRTRQAFLELPSSIFSQ